MNLTITKEKVLEAASKCSQARTTLKILFPEAFASPGEVDVCDSRFEYGGVYLKGERLICVRTVREYEGRAFCLHPDYEWAVKIDSRGYPNLVPTKKEQ